jgi:hypothetical protein
MNSFQRCLNENTLMWGLRQASELALPEKTGRQLSRAYVTQIVEVPPSGLLAPSDFFLSSQESAPWQVSAWPQKVSVTGQAGQATQALPYCGVYIQKSMAGENPESPADGGDSVGVPSIFLVALQRTQWDPVGETRQLDPHRSSHLPLLQPKLRPFCGLY